MATTDERGETLYRVRRPSGKLFDFVTSAELASHLSCFEEVGKPEHQQLPHARYYCHGEGCVVRQVEVRCKLFGEPMPAMKCPACGAPLELLAYLREVVLEPAK